MTSIDAPRAATVANWWPWLALPAVAASVVTLGVVRLGALYALVGLGPALPLPAARPERLAPETRVA